jgi:putative ABC transport system substrate-binding protein
MARIGIIVAGQAYPLQGFKLGLRDLGWLEGENISFELRAAEGELRRLPEFAKEIVSAGVDAIAVIGAVTVRTVRQVTSKIPIVFAVVVEPIGDGLVDNLQRPGGNVTGVTTFDPQQAGRQLQLLKAVSSGLERVAILSDRGVTECLSNSNRQAAKDLGLRAQVIRVEGPRPEYEKAFAAMDQERAGALVVLEEPINQPNRKTIADLAAACRLPTVFPISMADAGGLFAYGTPLQEAAGQMAPYVDKILKGSLPGELPIETSSHHELIVNLAAARHLRVTVPPALLARANQTVQ